MGFVKVALVGLGVSLVPVSLALADSGSGPAKTVEVKQGKGDKKFPMEGQKFLEKVDGRIAKARERLVQKMEERKVPAEKRAKILKEFQQGSAKIRGAARAAAKDGTVTKDEAERVREIRKAVRQEFREKFPHGKGKRGGKRGKGKPA